MAITISSQAVTDWTAVAQNAVGESATIDISGNYDTTVHIQAFLDTTTAHAAGTNFRVQVSSTASGDEDWTDFHTFNGLTGTAATDLIENNPLAATSTSITLTSHALTALGKWLGIEDGTLANSELVFETAQSANAVTILDGTTNEHAVNTAIFNIALSEIVVIPAGKGLRARMLVNNTIVAAGSTLNYKILATKVTAI